MTVCRSVFQALLSAVLRWALEKKFQYRGFLAEAVRPSGSKMPCPDRPNLAASAEGVGV